MDLKIRGVVNSKTDNEKLVLEVVQNCNIGRYMVIDTTFNEDGKVSNLHRHVFFFPHKEVKRGELIFLFSKKSVLTVGYTNDTNEYYHSYNWNLDVHVWNNDGDEALLIHYLDFERKKVK